MMELLSSFRDFMDKGGDVLYAILFLAIWLWWLILERYYYFFTQHKVNTASAISSWNSRTDHTSWFAETKRTSLISEVDLSMLKNLKLIPVLIALMPMFGLLGTVTGMIQVFEVMAYMGSGNPRAMADGVSAATIPTMGGMVVALIAIPFSTQLDRRYKAELQKLNEKLKIRE